MRQAGTRPGARWIKKAAKRGAGAMSVPCPRYRRKRACAGEVLRDGGWIGRQNNASDSELAHPAVFRSRGSRGHWEAITMTNNENTSPLAPPLAPDHHSNAAIASIWVLLLVLIAVIEIGSLLMSRSMLAGILH